MFYFIKGWYVQHYALFTFQECAKVVRTKPTVHIYEYLGSDLFFGSICLLAEFYAKFISHKT